MFLELWISEIIEFSESSEVYLEPTRISTMELFYENS